MTTSPSPSIVRSGRPGLRAPRARRVLLAAGCAAALAVTGCGGDDGDDGKVQGKVVTTDAGTVIVRGTTDGPKLKFEVQDSSAYVSATKETPAAAISGARGQTIQASCTLKDGRTIGPMQLIWREDAGDWGASLEVQGVYRETTPLSEVVRSCALSGPVTAKVSFAG